MKRTCSCVLSLVITLCFFLIAETVSVVRANGTVDPAFPALASLGLDPETNPTADNTELYFHLFESLNIPNTVEVPVLAAPVCVAHNGASALEFTLANIGAWMLGTDPGSAVNSQQAAAVSTADLKLVLAADSATTRVLLTALVNYKVAGFTSKTALPAAVLANSSIIWATDDADVVSKVSAASNRVGFVPLARGAQLPCAALVVTDPISQNKHTRPPQLPADAAESLVVDVEKRSITASTSSSLYPLIGPVLVMVPILSPCNATRADVVLKFLKRLLTDTKYFTPLAPSGFAEVSSSRKLQIFQAALTAIGRKCSSTVKYVRAGGSSAIEPVAAAWVLEYLRAHDIFIDYTPAGSGAGVAGVKERTYRFAGSDALLTQEERAAHPGMRSVPAVAFSISILVNLHGVTSVVLPRCLISSIFNGTVKYWNDTRIRAVNPGKMMPAAPIQVVVRSSSSGTTEIFTQGLRNLDLECFGTSNVVVTSVWALPAAITSSSTGGTFNALRVTPNSISFASSPAARALALPEIAFIHSVETGAFVSVSGAFLEGVLDGSTLDRGTGNLKILGGATSYPFVGINYLLFETGQPAGNCSEVKSALDFITWAQTSESGRKIAVSNGYVPMTADIVAQGQAEIRAASCGGDVLYPQPLDALTVGLAAGIPSAVALLVAIALLNWWIATRGRRSLEFAVRDTTKPFVVLFTDIQSSTSLWAAAPEKMGPALDLHNAIMEKVAADNNMFIVKFIGDSAMMVTQRPEDALRCVHDMQLELLNADWDVQIDNLYNKILDDGVMYSKETDSELVALRRDSTLFSGLCVRVGMHWTTADIRESDDLVDYFGIGIACAARIESCAHGGQLLASAEFMQAVEDKSVLEKFAVTDLGKQMLRGVTDPVQLVQLIPEGLARRRFPPLRLDRCEADDEFVDLLATDSCDHTASTKEKSSDQHSNSGESRTSALKVCQVEERFAVVIGAQSRRSRSTILLAYDTIRTMLTTVPKDARAAMLQSLAQFWRVDKEVQSSTHRAFKQELGHERYLCMRLAGRVETTRQQQQLHEGGARVLSKSNSSILSAMYSERRDGLAQAADSHDNAAMAYSHLRRESGGAAMGTDYLGSPSTGDMMVPRSSATGLQPCALNNTSGGDVLELDDAAQTNSLKSEHDLMRASNSLTSMTDLSVPERSIRASGFLTPPHTAIDMRME